MPPMKSTILITTLFAAFAMVSFADDNHEIIEKVMKEGLKGETSPGKKLIEGTATDAEIKTLAELIGTLKGTKAPRGAQAAYDKKVDALIAAINTIAGGDKSDKAIGAFKKAQNCKSCHNDHKPE